MPFVPALGQSDFRDLRRAGAGYVDKTSFIAQLLADPAQVVLLPRPRRFGKTLNLSTIAYFLRKCDEDLSPLFQDLAVWSNPAARAHFQQHPVLFLTFKDIKTASYETTLDAIRTEVRRLYSQHQELLQDDVLRPDERRHYEHMLFGEIAEEDCRGSLRELSDYLARYHGRKVVILIDEYDTPIQSGYLNGFFDEVTLFFRNFFSAALKDNPSLFKGVLTGVLRVARENLFSGLNNVIVSSILNDRRYATSFGFTEAEVAGVLEQARPDSGPTGQTGSLPDHAPPRLDEVRAWYNGYLFGGEVIYNPWSILNCVDSGALRPYWVNTASNDLLHELIARRGLGLSTETEALLRGEPVEARIDENIVLRDLDRQPEALWSFLLFSGYLTPRAVREEIGKVIASLAIPNIEVRVAYRDLFDSWLRRGLPERRHAEGLLRALLAGDAPSLEALLERLLVTVMSYQDPAGREPEKLYHGFILGLLVQLEGDYDVRSNRESGLGRADVLVRPRTPGRPGVVLELKVPQRGETPEQALLAAARQVRDRRYAAELVAAGAAPVHALVAVFDGKRAWVRPVDDVLSSAEGGPSRG
ncbi:AAA family ATPase [Sorangium sp. So ce542]|uniref:AAA family ATPase n=1 Tax=Sorangium sp. So ce542 TaxID=3133316 RepID=UPI003F5F88F5